MFDRRDLGDELHDLRKDIEKLRGDAASAFRALVDASRDEAGDVGGRFMRRARNWIDELREDFNDARSRGDSRLEGVTDFVSSKPLLGIALGVGVGIALASLMRHRD